MTSESIARLVLNSKTIKRNPRKRYMVLYNGTALSLGSKSKIVWGTYSAAKEAVINAITTYNYIEELGCFETPFKSIKSATNFVEDLILSGELVIKEIAI